MKISMKTLVKTFILSVLTLLIVACQPTQSPLSAFIPEDAVGVVYLEDPAGFLQNTSEFTEGLGLTALTGDKSPQAYFSDLKNLTDGKLDAAWFDLSRPSVIALLSDSSPIIAVPVKSEDSAGKGLATFLSESLSLKTQVKDGWVVASGKELTLPLTKGFDFTKLSTGSKQGLRYYLNIPKAMTLGGVSPDQVSGFLDEFMSEIDGLGTETAVFNKIIGIGIDGLKQLNALSGSVNLSSVGFNSFADLSFTPEGTFTELLARQGQVNGSREFLKYLPQDYLLGFISNMDSKVWMKEMQEFNRVLYEAQGLSPELVTLMTDYQDVLLTSLGNRIALSFDVDYDLKALSSMDLAKGLKLYFVGVMDLKDTKAYREKTNEYFSSSIMKDNISSLLKESGVPITLDLITDLGKKDGVLDYDSVKFKFGVNSGGTADSETTQVIAMLSQLDLQLFMAYKNDKTYLALGSGALEGLKALVEKDAYDGKTWAQGGLENLEAAYPDNAHLAWNFNVNRLLQLIRKVPEASMVPAGITGSPGLLGYVQLDKGVIKTGTAWNFKELEALVKPFSAFIPLMLGNLGGSQSQEMDYDDEFEDEDD